MVLKAQRILSPGTRLAGYRIEAEIGRGATAVVYRAIQVNLERPVALKVLSDELAADAEFVARFLNEARAAAGLSHPNIIQVYEAGVAEGNLHYLAMEYVAGETLRERIRREGSLAPAPGLALAVGIAEALNYGWQKQRLTHGDIKPDNIMVTPAGEARLADFGLARVAGREVGGAGILLTPLYAAPEVIRGEGSRDDCRADIYSFGATLYHMFSGTPPFPGEDAHEVMQRHLSEPLEPLSRRNPAVPGCISDLVGCLLAREAARRPADWEAVLAGLRRVRALLAQAASPRRIAVPAVFPGAGHGRGRGGVAPAPRRRWRSVLAAAGALTAALAAAALVARHGLGVDRVLPAWPWVRGFGAPAPAGARTDALPDLRKDGVRDWRGGQPSPRETDTRPQAAGSVRPSAPPAPSPGSLPAEPAGTGTSQAAAAPQSRVSEGGQQAGPQGAAPGDGFPGAGSGSGQTPGAPTDPAAARAGSGAETRLADSGGRAGGMPLPGTAAGRPAPEVDVTPTPADQREDAFVGFMDRLARVTVTVPPPVEPLLAEARAWLLRFPEDTPERAQMVFVANTVLPALEEVVPKLVANRQALAGYRLSGRTYGGLTVKDVSLTRLVLQEQTPHGVIARPLPWARVENLVSVLTQLSRVVAGQSASWAERAPLLALTLFGGNAKAHEAAFEGLPETPEKADWQRLRAGLAHAPQENKALQLWQKALAARADGEYAAAYRLLGELQASRTRVRERYAARCGALRDALEPSVPDAAGGKLVREARDLLDKDPAAGLARLLAAANRYGDADFPEKEQLERLRRQAVATVPVAEWQRDAVQRNPPRFLVPFGECRPCSGLPVLSLRLHLAAGAGSSRPDAGPGGALPVLEVPALLELGDWEAAARLGERLDENALASLPEASRAGALFARALLEARRGKAGESAAVAALLRCMPAPDAGTDGEYALLPQSLALEYGLFLRAGTADLAAYLAGGKGPPPRGPPGQRARFLLDFAALALDRGQTETAGRLLPVLATLDAGAADWGLSPAEAAFVRAALTRPQDARGLAAALSAVPDPEVGERHLRLAVTAALTAGRLDDALWVLLTELGVRKGAGFGPVGGAALYDLAAARAAQRLADGDAAAAEETAAWALALTHPCLAPYYARLLFLRWGLQRLQGPAGVRQLAELVCAAGSANLAEKALSKQFLGETLRAKARNAVRGNPEGNFWMAWLDACAAAGRRPRTEPENPLAGQAALRELPRAERLLAEGLARWNARAGASPPAAPAAGTGLPAGG